MADGIKISQLAQFSGKQLSDILPFVGAEPYGNYVWTVQKFLNLGMTGITGGGASNLDGWSTVNEAAGQFWNVVGSDNLLMPYQLQLSTAAANVPNIVHPLDFSAGNNPKVFQLLGFKGAQMVLTGTGGAGFAELPGQSGAPSTPSSALRVYADSSNRLSWIAPDGFTRAFSGTLTSSRVYTLPDVAGTLALVASTVPSIAGTANQVLVNGATTAVTGSAVTLSLATSLAAINAITSAAGQNLVLGTGTSGTAITVASANNAVTFAGNVTSAGVLQVNDSGSAPVIRAFSSATYDAVFSSYLSGVREWTFGGKRSDAGFHISSSGGVLGTNDVLSITPAGFATFASNVGIGAGAFSAGSLYTDTNQGLVVGSKTGTINDLLLATPTGSAVMKVPTGTQNATFAAGVTVSGNLTVSGTGASTFAASVNVSTASGVAQLTLNAPATSQAGVVIQNAGTTKWNLYRYTDGTNNLGLYNQTLLGDAITVAAADSKVSLAGNLAVNGTGTSTYAGNLTVSGTGFFGGNSSSVAAVGAIKIASANGASGFRTWQIGTDQTSFDYVIKDIEGGTSPFEIAYGSGATTIRSTQAASGATNGALSIGSNVGLSGNAGGTSYFGGPVSVSGKISNGATFSLAGDVSTSVVNLSATGYGLRVQGGASGSGYIFSANDYTGSEKFNIAGNGKVTLTPTAYSQAVWNGTGALAHFAPGTVTDSSTAVSGTAASEVFYSFWRPTLAATNTGVTTTDAATIYVQGGPQAGTNQTITNSWGIWNAGNARIDGTTLIGSTLTVNGEFHLQTSGTDRAKLRSDASGNLVMSGTGSGAAYIAFDSGTGGTHFGDGAGHEVGYITSAGVMSLSGTGTHALAGPLQINGTNAIKGVRTLTTSLDFGSVAAGGHYDLSVTVTGAAVGDTVEVNESDGNWLPDGIRIRAQVTATNTVTVRAINTTAGAIDPSAQNFRITVISF